MHLDPMGTLMPFIVGFGWPKHVPANYYKLRNFRVGLIFVSLAGCAVNILIATIAILLLQSPGIASNRFAVSVFIVFARINIILGAFNLIPIPPLDGSKILMGLLPYEAQRKFAKLEPYGLMILVFLLFTGLLTPVISFVQRLIIFVIAVFISLIR
jgi:Zn-dependent protease